MPTTILDGESYPQALARRHAEEAATDARIHASAEWPCPVCGMDWAKSRPLPDNCPTCGANTLPF